MKSQVEQEVFGNGNFCLSLTVTVSSGSNASYGRALQSQSS